MTFLQLTVSLIAILFVNTCFAVKPMFYQSKSGGDVYIVRLHRDTVNKYNYMKDLKQILRTHNELILFDFDADFFYGFSVSLDKDSGTLQRLRDDERITYILQDSPAPFSAYQSFGVPRALNRISSEVPDIPSPWEYSYADSAGEGVDIYVADTGVNMRHMEFWTSASDSEPRVVCGFSIEHGGCEDEEGHGTAVAALAAGRTVGVARKARIIVVDLDDDDGFVSDTGTLEGLNYVWTQAQRSGRPSVLNLSFGCVAGSECYHLAEAFESLSNVGVVVVHSAGNDGLDLSEEPAYQNPNIINVGALNSKDQKAAFSNYGENVLFWAPGENIKSAWIQVKWLLQPTSYYKGLEGTSFSAPLVAGIAAVHISEMQDKKSMTPAMVKDMLIKSAVTINGLLVPQVPPPMEKRNRDRVA